LTPKEFALLFTLVQNEGREVSSKELYTAAWGLPAYDDARTVWPHISKLKKKLGLNKDGDLSIETHYATGYQFNYRRKLKTSP
jgi:DNA-binding response OmpR family regulator